MAGSEMEPDEAGGQRKAEDIMICVAKYHS
jgi:hypothetical protein